jgi:endonuclease/exonuclease/phosphatase family metal-dependent hydrolase
VTGGTPGARCAWPRTGRDVLRPINHDIVLLQEVRDYDACARLGEAIAPGIYHVAICSAFREPFHSGLGRQQVAILSKYQAQAAWSEPWKSMNGVGPPRGFAFAWFKIRNEDVGVYSLHLKSILITHGDREAETAKNIRKREVAIAQLLTHVHDVIGMTNGQVGDTSKQGWAVYVLLLWTTSHSFRFTRQSTLTGFEPVLPP